jgi:hypothetical protein
LLGFDERSIESRVSPNNAPAVTNTKKSRLLVAVDGKRSTEYVWETVTEDFPPKLRLTPCGETKSIPEIDVTETLVELFRVYSLRAEWHLRELALAESRNAFADDPFRQKWAGLLLEMKRSFTRVTPDTDAKFAAWLQSHSNRDKRWRARKRFGDGWADFSAAYAPLGMDSADFGERVSDLKNLVQEVEGGRDVIDDPALRYLGDVKVARARTAAAKVVDGLATDERTAPDLFSALAYAIEHSHDFGVRYRICEETTCERLYVLPRTTKRFCSDACKQAHYRLAKQR